jgi:radical SAM superfamily enzyme YgiQ (UPF0313 family)
MKLLLIEPVNQLKIKNKLYQALENIIRKDYFTVPPLALGVIAGLTPSGWEIKIVQEPLDVVNYDEPADLVGISAVTHTVRRGYELAQEFRKRGKKVIMGGIHPSVLPDEALQYCDSVCIGEAENVWMEVLEDFIKGKLKKKYKSEEPFDLKLYTYPRRDLIDYPRSFVFNIGSTIEASRGCPYNCDFCSVSFTHGKKIRYRPVNNIIPEIESIKNRKLFFVDNNIIASFKYAKELFKAMIPLKKKWAAQATISIVKDPELLKLASDSGCYGLLIGIESVSDEGLKRYRKSLGNYEKLKEAIRVLNEHNIDILAHMIFGTDFDSAETMKESLDRLLDLDIASAQLGIVVPYPGTILFEKLQKDNRILTTDWNYYDIHHIVFKPLNFSIEMFLKDVEIIRNEFYSYSQIFKRAWRSKFLLSLGLNITSRSHSRAGYVLESISP